MHSPVIIKRLFAAVCLEACLTDELIGGRSNRVCCAGRNKEVSGPLAYMAPNAHGTQHKVSVADQLVYRFNKPRNRIFLSIRRALSQHFQYKQEHFIETRCATEEPLANDALHYEVKINHKNEPFYFVSTPLYHNTPVRYS